jgi:hypothetical protein
VGRNIHFRIAIHGRRYNRSNDALDVQMQHGPLRVADHDDGRHASVKAPLMPDILGRS